MVLDFDHLRDKEAEISNLVMRRVSLEQIKAEIEKCVVRCANCHRRKTSMENGAYRLGLRPGRDSNPRPSHS